MKFRRIGLDTNVLIYYIEEHPVFLGKVEPLMDQITNGTATGITSYVTLLELLVIPFREKRQDLVEQYLNILINKLEMVPLDEIVSIKAAELRAKYRIRTPDAIQIASVLSRNAEVFITNDDELKKVKELKILTLKDLP